MADSAEETAKQLEELAAKKAELESLIEKTKAEAEDWKKKFEEAKEGRDKAKEKARKEAEAAGEYSKALELLKSETAEAVQRKEEEMRAQLKILEDRIKADEDKQRAKLIEKLPADKRDAAKALDIAALEYAVSLIPENAPIGVNGANHQGNKAVGTLKWSEMSNEQRDEFSRGKSAKEIMDKIKAG